MERLEITVVTTLGSADRPPRCTSFPPVRRTFEWSCLASGMGKATIVFAADRDARAGVATFDRRESFGPAAIRAIESSPSERRAPTPNRRLRNASAAPSPRRCPWVRTEPRSPS